MARRRRRRSFNLSGSGPTPASRRRRARRTRRNPSGGLLPAIGGFLAVPIATHFTAAISARFVPPSNGAAGVNNRAQVFDVATAVLSWAGRDRVKDPGWRSFVTGGMWGSIVSAVLRPVVYGMLAARGELNGPMPVVDNGNGVAPYLPPAPPARTVVYAEEDEGYDYEPTNYNSGSSSSPSLPGAPALPGMLPVLPSGDDDDDDSWFPDMPDFGF